MKRNADELIEEISDFLVVYLKSGKVGLNSFIKKAHLEISQLEQLLQIHFLLKEEVKEFVRELPLMIRRFKTSTNVKTDTYQGEVRGQINWQSTIKERLRLNTQDKTIFSVNERNRNYAIKENLILKELLQTLYSILFEKVDSDYYKKYEWFKEWEPLKETVDHMVRKNIYLSRVNLEKVTVTNRMIQETMKHRNPLYRSAANLLFQYRRLLSGKLNETEVQKLLRETFVFPEQEDVLFELYWVVQLIKHNSQNAQLQLMDGRNNLVAQWSDEEYLYKIYHDSTGSSNLRFNISVDEIKKVNHPFLKRKIESMNLANQLAKEHFGRGFDTSTYWSGRPDIIVEIYNRESDELKKVVIGEVKHTKRVEYAITGLRELVDYMKLVKDRNKNNLEEAVEIRGILFTDKIKQIPFSNNSIKIHHDSFNDNNVSIIYL
ncbi:hypothetical protein [Pseudalkalibacillus caeni]|uniref:Uncharacterized protein n=1 Tax=Exobacillus caeni TaxID=2574798 RepID=A0A5R9F2R9_9BACL|nr:hypothetical protein [Pseudalkalibacillus caeni]TLS36790.1 hypothetical protein FCL54_12595 [Pseudalkalibacillus caeni]